MRSDSFFRGVFLVYCLEAGLFLLLSPWLAAWNHAVLLLPFGPLRALMLSSWMRALISAFGLLHLLWSLHDLDLFLRRGLGSSPHASYPLHDSTSAGDQ
jgi:hypothetical protein